MYLEAGRDCGAVMSTEQQPNGVLGGGVIVEAVYGHVSFVSGSFSAILFMHICPVL